MMSSVNLGLVVTTLGRLDPLRALLTSLEGQLGPEDHIVLVAPGRQHDVAALATEFVARGVPVTATTSGRGASLGRNTGVRSEEHTSELQSLMRISYAAVCLKKKKTRS